MCRGELSDQLSIRSIVAAANAEAANNSDHEQDNAAKLVSLSPGRLEIPDRDNVPVTQIACGLQHTGKQDNQGLALATFII